MHLRSRFCFPFRACGSPPLDETKLRMPGLVLRAVRPNSWLGSSISGTLSDWDDGIKRELQVVQKLMVLNTTLYKGLDMINCARSLHVLEEGINWITCLNRVHKPRRHDYHDSCRSIAMAVHFLRMPQQVSRCRGSVRGLHLCTGDFGPSAQSIGIPSRTRRKPQHDFHVASCQVTGTARTIAPVTAVHTRLPPNHQAF